MTNLTKPRQYTSEEIREQFLTHIWLLIDDCLKEKRITDERQRLSSLAHSILTALDGYSSGLLGGFHLIPSCHEADPESHRDAGKNWWPSNEDLDLEKHCAISDVLLNDEFYQYDPRRSKDA